LHQFLFFVPKPGVLTNAGPLEKPMTHFLIKQQQKHLIKRANEGGKRQREEEREVMKKRARQRRKRKRKRKREERRKREREKEKERER